MNYTEVEIKVREATNEEAWGPHGSTMQEIAQYTLSYEHYSEVMGVIWKRLFQQEKECWRSIYKVFFDQMLNQRLRVSILIIGFIVAESFAKKRLRESSYKY